MHLETRYFFIFKNILGTFFQVMLSTIFYKVSGRFNVTLTLSLLAYFFSKNSLFLFLNKSQVQKSVDVFTCFFFPPPFFQCYLSLSVWCVCVLFIYAISISIICASQKELILTASNEQIYNFFK